ncbi:DUF4422 domain-containing protein [Veillonella sp.]|uniref:DUF4422 domain-containing protein n=1 Tax=Veillonella sp. TaxID=1926307 RepID=UPI0025CE0B0D|nr:DUF4422 domain-containing protein [Veillonella sp.]
MSNIKILVAAHKPYWMPNDDVYMPIHVGKEGKTDIGYIGDNTGDHISHKNANYCELTGLYWAWKNLEADSIGLVHYRRYFTKKEVRNIDEKKEQILLRSDWEKILAHYPVVVADKRKYYIESNRSHYNHAHHSDGLDLAEQIIQERYPEYRAAFDLVCKRTWAHMFNMFVMRRDMYDAYCEWLFDILGEIENRVDISSYDTYEARIYGFVSEILLDVWIEKNRVLYKEQNVSFMEKQNWIKKGGAFLKRKVFGK